jgi:hypothetical protein
MRRALIVLLVALAGALLMVPAAGAAEESAQGPGAAQPPSMIEGTVSSVDWGAGKLTVGGVAGFLGTEVRVNPETKITGRGDQRLSIRDIRQGDVIRARYRKVGDQNMATTIAVLYAQGRQPSSSGEGGAGQTQQGAPPQSGGSSTR